VPETRHGAPEGERATPVAREDSERIPALRIPWLATLIAIAAILAASHFSFSRLRAQVRSGTFDELDAVARLKAEEMASWRDERLSDARSIAAHPLVARALHRLDADRARHSLVLAVQPTPSSPPSRPASELVSGWASATGSFLTWAGR